MAARRSASQTKVSVPQLRFPAEWEAQDAVVIAWPHQDTDWAPWLEAVERDYIALAQAILARANLLCLVANRTIKARAERLIAPDGNASHRHQLQCLVYDYDDTWLRDTGPISLLTNNAEPPGFAWRDFSFTGWGGKYGASKDDGIVRFLRTQPMIGAHGYEHFDFALEGGAIESDGAGTILSTWNCLSKRHPQRTRAQIDAILCQALASQRVLWLEHGELDGDDTDAHIDTLARFASSSTIVYQSCDDPNDPHFQPLQRMAAELAQLKQADGTPYHCVALPWAGELLASDGRRLAASYANFLILNGAVLMPAYGVDQDVPAASALAGAFDGYEIVSVPARSFIEQNGSVHCLTMQLPQGVLQAHRDQPE
jgi:agmatine/peptidylarginine deiminase